MEGILEWDTESLALKKATPRYSNPGVHPVWDQIDKIWLNITIYFWIGDILTHIVVKYLAVLQNILPQHIVPLTTTYRMSVSQYPFNLNSKKFIHFTFKSVKVSGFCNSIFILCIFFLSSYTGKYNDSYRKLLQSQQS